MPQKTSIIIREKGYMKNISKNLRKHTRKIISYQKKKKRKEMIPLTNKEKKSYCKQKVCDICKKEFS